MAKRVRSVDEAFLRDILTNPADDAPRLIYADWLQDHGDPERAEFIRVQVEHARLDPDDEARQVLARRAEALAAVHGKRWCEGLPTWEGVRWWFRRGFAADVVTPVEHFLARADHLRRTVPLEGADLRGNVSARLADLADAPFLAGLKRLELWDNDHPLGPDQMTALARCQHLGSLRSLGLTCQKITNAGVRTLVKAPGIGPLECLYLDHNAIGTFGGDREPLDLAPLADSQHAQSLTALYLKGSHLHPESYAHLGALPQLRAVTLGGVGPAAAKVLARSPGLTSWRALAITVCPGRVETVRALTGSPHLTGLVALELSHGDFTDATAKALAAWPGLERLRYLDLHANHLHDAGVVALAGSPHTAGLAELDLRFNKITAAGARALAVAPGLTSLRRLDIRGNKIPADALDVLRERLGAGLITEEAGWGDSGEWPSRRQDDLRGVRVEG
jgi:uncharacterized protein (TIGR02996 family)